jgi:hypothetical protein
VAEIQQADRRARSWALVLVGLGTLAGLVFIPFFESQRPALERWIADDFDNRVRVVGIGLAFAFNGPTLLFSLYLWRLGARIVRSARYPLPDMRMFHDTVVMQGDAARRRGRMFQAMSLFLAVAAVALGGLLWRLVNLLQSGGR